MEERGHAVAAAAYLVGEIQAGAVSHCLLLCLQKSRQTLNEALL